VGCALFRQWRLSADRRHAAGRHCRAHSGRGSAPDHRRASASPTTRPAGRADPATAVWAGARCSPIARGYTPSSSGQRAARHLRPSSGRGHGAPRSPERSTHRMTAIGPRGSRDCQPGGGPNRAGGRCTLIAGAVIAPHGSQRAAAVSVCHPGGGPRSPIAGGLHLQAVVPGPGPAAGPRLVLGRNRSSAGGTDCS
jgi:hypothetical protein